MKRDPAKAAKSDAARIEAYLGALDAEKRGALEKLRAQIRAAAPDAEECVSYQMPAFRRGEVILCYAAWREHCAIYPGAAIGKEFAQELASFDQDKGTVRFTPQKPIPAALVKKIVRARLAAIDAKRTATMKPMKDEYDDRPKRYF